MTYRSCAEVALSLVLSAVCVSAFSVQPDGNRPPHADPGPTQRVGIHLGDQVSVTLDGSKSSDPNPDDLLTYTWRDASGQVIGGDSAVPIVHLLISTAGTYTYSLTVTDPAGASNMNTTQVDVVLDYTPPVVSAPDLGIGITETGGARGANSPKLHAYLDGSATSATDDVTPNPFLVDVEVGGAKADDNTLFPIGATPVVVKYADQAGNVGVAHATVQVIDHQDNDVFVVADSQNGSCCGSIVIVRVRGGASEPFCSPTQYVPFSEGVPVIVDSQGRVVFLGYMGWALGFQWALYRCSVRGAAPEIIAQFRNGDIGFDLAIPEAFPGTYFTNMGSLHLETLRSITIDHGGNPHVITEEAYVMAARPAPGPHVEAIRYRVKTGIWEDGTTVPDPIQRGTGCCGNDALPFMLSHGGASYSSDGGTLRRTRIPLQIDVSGTIGATDFHVDLALFGKTSEIPVGTRVDDLATPNVDSFCPNGQPEGNLMPIPRFGPGFSSFGALLGLFADEFTGHGLIATSNSVTFGGAIATVSEDVLDGQEGPKFMNPFAGCGMVTPVVAITTLLPSFDLQTGSPNDVPPLASAPNGLYAVIGRSPIQVATVDNLKLHVTATLPYSGLPSSIAAFPAAVPAPSANVIFIEGDSPVDVVATDPNGKRIGVVNGEPVNDFGDDGFDSGPGEPRFFAIRNPVAGRFGLQGVGTGDGPFTVHVYSVDLDKPFGTHEKVSGTASPGSTASYDFDRRADGTVAFVNLAPVANAGPDQTVDADARGRAAVVLDGSQSTDPDGDPLTYTWSGPFGVATGPRPRVTVPAGVHAITLTVNDGKGGTASALVTITVHAAKTDTTPPVLTLPGNLTVEATSAVGTAVSFTTSATDLVDGARPVTCAPASGAVFPIGITPINCTAADLAGNVGVGSFAVAVRDTVAPALALPPNQLLEAAGPGGAVATFTATANDVVDGVRPVSCSMASGTLFPLGTTTVDCVASDAAGNFGRGSFAVVVRDSIPPGIGIATPSPGATYALNQKVSSSYGCSDTGSGVATCAGPVLNGGNIDTSSGGTKKFTVTASDAAGNASTKSVEYQVECHYVTIVPNPSTVRQGGTTMVNATVGSCASTAQVVSIRFALTGPIASRSCGAIRTDMFSTPTLTLPSNTFRSVSFPFRVPDQTCPGTYSLTATTAVGGKAVDTSTSVLTVTAR